MIGISTACFYPELTENALHTCGEAGISCTEIFLNAPSELSSGFLKKLNSIKNQTGIKILSVHPFTSSIEGYLLFSEYLRRFEDGREFYKRYAEAAAQLGAKYVVLHGDRHPRPVISAEEYTYRFMKINEDMKQFGVTLAQENVNLYRAASPQFIRDMRRFSGDEVSFTFDVKQSVRAGYTPDEIIDAMGDRIVHVHLSDHDGERDCILPGKGLCDFGQIFYRLSSLGYKGDYVVEVYHDAYKNAIELIKSAEFLANMYRYTFSK